MIQPTNQAASCIGLPPLQMENSFSVDIPGHFVIRILCWNDMQIGEILLHGLSAADKRQLSAGR